MKPSIDTTQYRDAIKQACDHASKEDPTPKYKEGEGVEQVPADDQQAMGESVHPIHTVKHWAGWVYQKREDGKWDKLCPSPKRKIQKKPKE